MPRYCFFFFFAKAPVSNEQPCYGRMALKHVISYVKQMTSPGLMHDTGCSGLVHRDDPEGWDGEGGGRRVQDGEHMHTQGGFKSMYGNTNKIV